MKLNVTYCSGKKHQGIHSPDQLYDSLRIHRFTTYCSDKNTRWAILSAKYGLFFPEEKRESYDVTLQTDRNYWLGIKVAVEGKGLLLRQSKAWLERIADTIRRQALDRSITEMVFYTWSLKQPKCYLALLHFIFDGCTAFHRWDELLDCIMKNKRIQVTGELTF